MDFHSEDTRSPKRIRLSPITNHPRTPQATSHPQLARIRNSKPNPSPSLTPDAKAKRRKAIEAALAADENAFARNTFILPPSQTNVPPLTPCAQKTATTSESPANTTWIQRNNIIPANLSVSSLCDSNQLIAVDDGPLLVEKNVKGSNNEPPAELPESLFIPITFPDNPSASSGQVDQREYSPHSKEPPDPIIARHRSQFGDTFRGFTLANSGKTLMPSGPALSLAQKKMNGWELEPVAVDEDDNPVNAVEAGAPAEVEVDQADSRCSPELNESNAEHVSPTRVAMSQRTSTVEKPLTSNAPLAQVEKVFPTAPSINSPSNRNAYKPVSKGFSGLSRSGGGRHNFKPPLKSNPGPAAATHKSAQINQPQRSSNRMPAKDLASHHSEASRSDLATSGFKPNSNCTQAYQLETSSSRVEHLHVHPRNAVFIHLPIAASLRETHPSLGIDLGPNEVHEILLSEGCEHITMKWVKNAWGLVLWKLAGMCMLQPPAGQPQLDRWNATEVLIQLRRRYECEFGKGFRSPFHRIEAQDAPPSYPMVLCVSDILGPSPGREGSTPQSIEEIEVTDGWYRLRATVDAPLQRALYRKKLRTGMKLACFGAKLVTAKKQPKGILEAYESTSLTIFGNSTHLAPWHAKLGYREDPFIASLRSLSPDGGMVPMIYVTMKKILPVAFFEFVTDESGQQRRLPPRNQADEDAVQKEWEDRRCRHLERLQQQMECKIRTLHDLSDRLRSQLSQKLDAVPREVVIDIDLDDVLDQMQSGTFKQSSLNSLDRVTLENLKDEISEKLESTARLELMQDLDELCPPRQVRSFRVVYVKDALNISHPSSPSAQITIWDAGNQSEERDVFSNVGQQESHFILTNLQPTQPRAWMSFKDPGAEIYLSTRRDTRILACKRP